MRTPRPTPVLPAALLLCLLTVSGCSSDDGAPAAPVAASAEAAVETAVETALEDQVAGRTDEAVRGYEAVLAADPRNTVALYNLGLIAQERGDEEQATTRYEAALEADDAYVPALFNLAILQTAGDPAAAEALYRRALAADDQNAQVQLNLGFLLVDSGRADEGRELLRRAVTLDPSLTPRVPPGVL